jgi:hypothetical protein
MRKKIDLTIRFILAIPLAEMLIRILKQLWKG